jgi:glycosyltransferase involved in cell wall biosynthesis
MPSASLLEKNRSTQPIMRFGADASVPRRIAYIAISLTRQNPPASTLVDLIEAAVAKKHDVTIFSAEVDECLKGKIKHYQIPIVRFLGIPGVLVSFHLAHLPVYFFAKLLRRARFDVVHALDSESFVADHVTFHNCCAEYLSIIRKKKLWSPVYNITSVLTNLALMVNLTLRASIEKFNCRRAKHIFALTPGHKNMLISRYKCDPTKISIVPNYIQNHLQSNSAFREGARHRLRQALRLSEADFVGLFVAQGAWVRKGLIVLLDSLAILKREVKISLLVVGKGSSSEALWFKKYAEKIGIADQVLWLGFQKNVFEYCMAADCFIHPSYYETFSLATLEGLAAGLPLLLSNVGGAEQIVTSGENGFLVEINPTDISRKLSILIRNRELSRSFAAKSSEIAAHWRAQSHVEKILRQYENK